MIRRFLLFTLLFCMIAPSSAPAQLATLIADNVRIDGPDSVTAALSSSMMRANL